MAVDVPTYHSKISVAIVIRTMRKTLHGGVGHCNGGFAVEEEYNKDEWGFIAKEPGVGGWTEILKNIYLHYLFIQRLDS